MHESELFGVVAAVLCFLLLSAWSLPVSRWVGLPHAVLLVLIGICIPSFTHFIEPSVMMGPEGGFIQEVLVQIRSFSITPDIVFFVFLPTLIFESSFHLRLDSLRRSITHISLLATAGVILSAGLIAVGCVMILGIPWEIAILFGIMISATDPVAVLGNFRTLGAPRRLRTIVEGESLFNDATTLVVFNAVLAILATSSVVNFTGGDISDGFGDFLYGILGGVMIGTLVSVAFALMIQSVKDSHNLELTLVFVLAHSSFLLAEIIGVSGIISTVVAGVIMGNYGRRKLSSGVVSILEEVWDHFSFLINGLVFLLVGISLVQIFDPDQLFVALGAALITSMARYLTVIPLMSFANVFVKPLNRTPLSWQAVISHGGFRGVLTVVMLLLVPEDGPIDTDLLTAMVVGSVLFSLFFHASTVGLVIQALGITKFRPHDHLELSESRALVSRTMQFHLRKIRHRESISPAILHELEEEYKHLEHISVEQIHALLQSVPAEQVHLDFLIRKHALGIERQVYYDLYKRREIQESTLVSLLGSLERQRDRMLAGLKQDKRGQKTPFMVWFNRREQLMERYLGLSSFHLFGLRNALFQAWRKRTLTRKHEQYRARSRAAQEVAVRLSELVSSGVFGEHVQDVDGIREQYAHWHQHATQKQQLLEQEYPEYLIQNQRYLLRRNVSEKEAEVLEQLHELGMISDKIYLEAQKEQSIRNGA